MSAWVKTKELSGDDKLEYLREKYKDRNLLEELGWGAYNIHSGYLNKADADFLNWLCNAAYREIKKLKCGITIDSTKAGKSFFYKVANELE